MKRILCAVLALVLLAAALPAFAAPDDQPAPTVRILLRRLALTDRIDLWLDAPYTLSAAGISLLLPAETELRCVVRGESLVLFIGDLSLRVGSSALLQRHPTDGELDGFRVAAGGNTYPADLRLTVSGGQLTAVASLSLEHYLMGVVPYEMSNDFPLEALKAQAVCARTYAVAHLKPDAAYDMVDTTDNQVFRGVDPDQRNALRAVRETAGVIATYKGNPITCYYAASNGGQTDLPSHVWGDTSEDACYAVTDDPYDLENRESPVVKLKLAKKNPKLPEALTQLLAQALTAQRKAAGFSAAASDFRVDRLLKLEAVTPLFKGSRCMTELKISFGWSGRKPTGAAAAATAAPASGGIVFDDSPTAAPAVGPFETGGEATVTLSLFSGTLLADLGLSISGTAHELISVTETDGDFILASRRYGHGVGMSQRGAQQMAAAHGMKFTEILAFYYPKIKLMQASTGLPQLPTPDPALAATPGPAATPTPRPTLMPVTGALPKGAYYAAVENIEDDSSLNLRAAPNTAADILLRLYKHQRLIVLAACDEEGWVKVKTDAIEGYVMEKFLVRE